ncbi:sarcosine oxidase subunit alpha family protein [Stutzerimonas kirkiae]|uniref:Sarcosine oxidase subunit alpha family protein n=1 Tax=Stutzerimonas kirkiae TaxID=2211392 RepID=A0A4Q9RD81_9GAMM|nr:2Fe-2S iron-sulfur cluster-binding protein [Stutzerimonas kirkiae]TBU97881.1 sarcosine oxidase subunit alpha family protein [Stutzerimonas kirkiae]TBV04603.1 sarcosine oxidase subunit alpha family protein [Stutzerimonas kirkiae]TBV16059.1 sarcosine oxidase subunit alpha family protein [Stutzerimonas kirkiae]
MSHTGQPLRLPGGGLIDRSQPLDFHFDGQLLHGFAGDTLASALLANDVRLLARSFKYHRPRGLYASGGDEPNALLGLGSGAEATPNSRATQVPLRQGLVAHSQNRWPSLRLDLAAASGWLAALLGPGFYYKTFMRPRWLWPWYERLLRGMAGMGRAPRLADPHRYEHRHWHCDCLVIGLGPAGLAAALAASESTGQRVIAVEADTLAGGSLLSRPASLEGLGGQLWAQRAKARLLERGVRVLQGTSAFGYYDDNLVAAVETLDDAPAGQLRERLHWIRAGRVILATGAHERPLVFPGNDRPGILLAGAARHYLHRHAVAPGHRVAILANNDDAHSLGNELLAAGVEVVAQLDTRPGHPLHAQALRTRGRQRLSGLDIERNGRRQRIDCDALCVSGGWMPAVQLHVQAQGTLRHDPRLDAFVPERAHQRHVSVGACNGCLGLDGALEQGWLAAGGGARRPRAASTPAPQPNGPAILATSREKDAFVDLQNDVSLADIRQAAAEGYATLEHLKRYTALGMGTDQGKGSNLNGLSALASLSGQAPAAIGTIRARAPSVPVSLGALAGSRRQSLQSPRRHSPLHDEHLRLGAAMVDSGPWRLPAGYPLPGETTPQSAQRESLAVHAAGGFLDRSASGRLELRGPDCVRLLQRLYANPADALAVGRAGPGLMLREDGLLFELGMLVRLADDHYLLTSDAARAAAVRRHVEYCLQVLWPELAVRALDVAEQWAAILLRGPQAQALLQSPRLGLLERPPRPGEALQLQPHGRPLRLFGCGLYGEPAWELHVPAGTAARLWSDLEQAGQPLSIAPYGQACEELLRIERGQPGGNELDGRRSAADLGLGHLLRHDKRYIGYPLLQRPGLADPARPRLVGLRPLQATALIPAGSQLLTAEGGDSLGHVSSAAHSARHGGWIALGLLRDGLARQGQVLLAADPLRQRQVAVRVEALGKMEHGQ